jgi:hypothetical protein
MEQDLRYAGTQRTSWNVLLHLLAGFALMSVRPRCLASFLYFKIAQSLPFLNNMLIVYLLFLRVDSSGQREDHVHGTANSRRKWGAEEVLTKSNSG